MTPRESVALSELTTLKVGGPASFVAECRTREDIIASLAFAREHGIPFVVLGEGSNVLASDEGYPGLVIRMQTEGTAFKEDGEDVLATVEAGVSWDALVFECAHRALWGIENLAGIPGTVGAAPVQNIGAYGSELETVFEGAEVLNAKTGTIDFFDREKCAFSYRNSIFKGDPSFIILSVSLRLARSATSRTDYADLRALAESGVDFSTPAAVGSAVRSVRAKKFPDLKEFGTAGSFFKNPIVSQITFEELTARYAAMPSFPVSGGVKLPLAFILDKVLGLRGYRRGPAFLFENQPLVLVADSGARAADIDALAVEIEQRVLAATGISIEREVKMLEAHESR